MSLATETIKRQRRLYFSCLLRGIALFAIGGYCGFMILRNGMGTEVQTGGGVNAILRKLMGWLTEHGINAEQLLLPCMAGLFCVIAAIGLYHLVRGIWSVCPTHTMFGKSVKTQMIIGESFDDAISSVNADMDQDPYVFGTVSIGRRWIVDEQAMRLSGIRGVYWFDQAMEACVLCCVDENQNIWVASLRCSSDRDNAVRHLNNILPEADTGDENDCMAFFASNNG